jgi:hypothetical protein
MGVFEVTLTVMEFETVEAPLLSVAKAVIVYEPAEIGDQEMP